MAQVGKVTFKWNEGGYRQFSGPGGPVDASVSRAASRTRDRAKRNLTGLGRVDTGRLRNSMRSDRLRAIPSGITYRVGSNLDYAMFQERGTRDHGPRRARVMRFKPKGGGAFVFAQRVRGVTPGNFLRDALKALKPGDFQ